MIPKRQLYTIYNLLFDASQENRWMTLHEIAALTGYGEASISAQLRNLRKIQHGEHTITKRVRRSHGPHHLLWEYQLQRTTPRLTHLNTQAQTP